MCQLPIGVELQVNAASWTNLGIAAGAGRISQLLITCRRRSRSPELRGDGKNERQSRREAAAKRLEFEEAAALRDKLRELRELQIYAG
jgi:hypothetical protein